MFSKKHRVSGVIFSFLFWFFTAFQFLRFSPDTEQWTPEIPGQSGSKVTSAGITLNGGTLGTPDGNP